MANNPTKVKAKVKAKVPHRDRLEAHNAKALYYRLNGYDYITSTKEQVRLYGLKSTVITHDLVFDQREDSSQRGTVVVFEEGQTEHWGRALDVPSVRQMLHDRKKFHCNGWMHRAS